MNKEELLAALEHSRVEFLKSIEGLPDEKLLEPGVVGEWSVKDILAHLSRWEAELVTLLFQAEKGLTPATALNTGMPFDEQNAKWHAQTKDRPLERVWADFDGVRKQTIRRVGSFSDRDLTDPQRFEWLKGTPLVDWITGDSTEHDAEHSAQIREWRQRTGV